MSLPHLVCMNGEQGSVGQHSSLMSRLLEATFTEKMRCVPPRHSADIVSFAWSGITPILLPRYAQQLQMQSMADG